MPARATLLPVTQTDPAARYALLLAKEDFKFAAAHFTLFPDGTGELLHGHNFRVRVTISGAEPDDMGLLADVAVVKEHIRTLCDRLDEHTLIPEQSALLELREHDGNLEIVFGERSYRLPADDVTLLPIRNVTIETLAKLVWDELAPTLRGARIDQLSVEVEETAGQSCTFIAPLG